MELVIDANILFAALIKNDVTSDLLVEGTLKLYSTEYILSEFGKYVNLIKDKTERTDEEFERFLEIIEKRITFLPFEDIKEFVGKAKAISPDSKDVPYIALALKLNIPLWSNDKNLKAQDRVKVYSTGEILKILKK